MICCFIKGDEHNFITGDIWGILRNWPFIVKVLSSNYWGQIKFATYSYLPTGSNAIEFGYCFSALTIVVINPSLNLPACTTPWKETCEIYNTE